MPSNRSPARTPVNPSRAIGAGTTTSTPGERSAMSGSDSASRWSRCSWVTSTRSILEPNSSIGGGGDIRPSCSEKNGSIRRRSPADSTRNPDCPSQVSVGTSVVPEGHHGLDAAVLERLGEVVDPDAEADELRQDIRPPAPGAIQRLDRVLPVLVMRVDAAEDGAVLQDRVDGEHLRIDGHLVRASVDPQQAGDAVAPEQRERVG